MSAKPNANPRANGFTPEQFISELLTQLQYTDKGDSYLVRPYNGLMIGCSWRNGQTWLTFPNGAQFTIPGQWQKAMDYLDSLVHF